MVSLEQRGTWCECGGAAVEGPLSQLRCCQWDPWSGSCMAGMEFLSWEVSFTLLPLQTQTKPEKLQHLGEAEFYLGQAVSHQHQFHTNWQIPSPPLSLQAASAVPGCPVRGTLQVTRAPPFSHRAPHDSLCVCVFGYSQETQHCWQPVKTPSSSKPCICGEETTLSHSVAAGTVKPQHEIPTPACPQRQFPQL